MRKLLLTLVLSSGVGAWAQTQEAADSIATQELKEVTVEGQLATVSARGGRFIPTKVQKEASQSGYDLLRRMAIPQLGLGIGDDIKTVDGQAVDIFIDGVPASADDVKGMRMTDVKRVEYYDYPTDVKFQGKAHVVNFIMQQYEYGGYVKWHGNAFLIANSGQSGIYSKFQYKRFTADLAVGGYYYNSRHQYNNTVETFRLPQADGGVNVFERASETTDARSIRKYAWPTLKTQYKSERMVLTNTVGGTFDNRPIQRSSGRVVYTLSAFESSDYTSERATNSNSVSYTGDWSFYLPANFSLNVSPNYIYTYRRAKTDYAEGGFAPIDNNAKERSHDYGVQVKLRRVFERAGSVSLEGMVRNEDYTTRYWGTTTAEMLGRRFVAVPSMTYSYDSDNLSVGGGTGYGFYRQSVNGLEQRTSSPFGNVYAYYSPSNRHRMGLSYNYSLETPEATELSEIEVRQNPLLTVKGQPNLKPYSKNYLGMSYTWIPSNGLQTGGWFQTAYNPNRYAYDYRATTEGVVREIVQDGGDYTNMTLGLFVSVKMFNSLQLTAQAEGKRTIQGVPYSWAKNAVNGILQAEYYAGGWNFGGYMYTTRRYGDGSISGDWTTVKPVYAMWAGWGNATWSASCTVSTPTRWNWHELTQVMDTPAYSAVTKMYSASSHAWVQLKASYTFGYGKKVAVGNEAKQQTGSKSAILF